MPPLPANKKNPQSRWAYMWLAYSGFILIQPILDPNLLTWIVTLGSLALFFLIFWVLFYVAKTHAGRCWLIFAVFVLGMVTFPVNQGASTYLIYAAAFLPFTLKSIRRVILFMLLEIAAVIAEGALIAFIFHPRDFTAVWINTVIAAFLILIVGGGNIYFAEQKRADTKLRSALEENVALAAVAERERIARDLHDVLGHTLSVVVLKAELAGRLVTIDPARAVSEMADVERTARSALAEIREAIGGYRSRGLAAEIEAARSILGAAGVNLLVESGPPTESFTPQQETALALALREAVTNIVRHAHATACQLRFLDRPGLRRLIVEDDGPRAVIGEGNGLRGMRERIESVGGHFTVELRATPERGLRLILDIPSRDISNQQAAVPLQPAAASDLRCNNEPQPVPQLRREASAS